MVKECNSLFRPVYRQREEYLPLLTDTHLSKNRKNDKLVLQIYVRGCSAVVIYSDGVKMITS